MTWNRRIPTRRNHRNHTAYERSRTGGRVDYDYDAYSDMTIGGTWASSITDWDDITMLAGLSEDQ